MEKGCLLENQAEGEEENRLSSQCTYPMVTRNALIHNVIVLLNK